MSKGRYVRTYNQSAGDSYNWIAVFETMYSRSGLAKDNTHVIFWQKKLHAKPFAHKKGQLLSCNLSTCNDDPPLWLVLHFITIFLEFCSIFSFTLLFKTLRMTCQEIANDLFGLQHILPRYMSVYTSIKYFIFLLKYTFKTYAGRN